MTMTISSLFICCYVCICIHLIAITILFGNKGKKSKSLKAKLCCMLMICTTKEIQNVEGQKTVKCFEFECEGEENKRVGEAREGKGREGGE